MMLRRLPVLLLTASLVSAWPLHAAPLPTPLLKREAPLRVAPDDHPIDAAEAARIAQRRHGGRVLDVRPAAGGWRVKLLRDGEVRTVFVPARR